MRNLPREAAAVIDRRLHWQRPGFGRIARPAPALAERRPTHRAFRHGWLANRIEQGAYTRIIGLNFPEL